MFTNPKLWENSSEAIERLLIRLSPQCEKATVFIKELLAAYQKGNLYIPLTDAEIKTLTSFDTLVSTSPRTPLIIDQGRLYIARLWQAERKVASHLGRLAKDTNFVDAKTVVDLIEQLFPNALEHQKQVLALSLRKKLLVISGEPSTGKTTLVSYLLAFLATHAFFQKTILIGLAGSDTKTVRALDRAIQNAHNLPTLSQSARLALPQKVPLLKTLLHLYPSNIQARYHKKNPLPLDILIIDEATSIDIELFAQITDALLSTTRLILLGNPLRVAHASQNSILTELYHTPIYQKNTAIWLNKIGCSIDSQSIATKPSDPLCDCIVVVHKKHALFYHETLSEFSEAILKQNTSKVLYYVNDPQITRVNWLALSDQLPALAIQNKQPYFAAVRQANPQEAFDAFNQFICVTSTSSQAHQLNAAQEYYLEQNKQKSPSEAWYNGRAILLNTNNKLHKLISGSIGLTLPTEEGLRVFFQKAHDVGYISFQPQHLPSCQSAWAIPIDRLGHLSFRNVWILLDEESTDGMQLHSALAKAQERVTLVGRDQTLLSNILSRPLCQINTTLTWRSGQVRHKNRESKAD